jgi:hypothetical protein
MEGHARKEEASTAIRDSELWREFGDDFQVLADEQRTIVRADRQGDRRLRAYCGYNADMATVESELVRLSIVGLLYRTESGTWQLGAGPNEDLKARLKSWRHGPESHSMLHQILRPCTSGCIICVSTYVERRAGTSSDAVRRAVTSRTSARLPRGFALGLNVRHWKPARLRRKRMQSARKVSAKALCNRFSRRMAGPSTIGPLNLK